MAHSLAPRRPVMPSPDHERPSGDADARARLGGRPFRPPTGLPASREDQRGGALFSIAAHVLVIALVAAPTLLATKATIDRLEQGAGGPGPAGGGGGGTRGTGGWTQDAERLVFTRPAAPAPKPAEPPPVPSPVPPVTLPPKPVATPPAQPVAPPAVAEQTATTATPPAQSGSAGTGGGTGSDGSGGNGPGSGGGVGSGIGTGRGSGVGPGTGGGTQANYPPTPTEMFLPPFPVPGKVKGFHLIAEFDVDEAGRVVTLTFTETRDGDYNRKLRDVLRSIRFRPGTRPDGTPVRMKAQIEYSF